MSRAVYDYNSVDWNSIFYYDTTSKTGLRWREDRLRGKGVGVIFRKAGDVAGSIHTDSTKNTKYATVSTKEAGRVNFFAHRVIWIMFNGAIDKSFVIDHIDGDSLNNNIANLRAVKQLNNNRNAIMRRDNSTGVKGVSFTTATNHKGGVYTYSTAHWNEEVNGEIKSLNKHFSCNKLGLLPAFAMACKYREDKIAKLNSLGYGYTESHCK